MSAEFDMTEQGELSLGVDEAITPATACPPGDDGPGCEEWVDRGWEPGDYGDPQTDPDDFEAWLAGLPAGVRADFLAGPFTGAGDAVPAGFAHRDRPGPAGAGFAAGGVLDTLVPGSWLAEALTAAAAASGGHGGLGESELIGVLCGWRRMASWAAAGRPRRW